jgi:hypothetical protein
MMLLAPVTNWEPHGVTLAGYCYAMRHGMKVQIVSPCRVSHLQRYGIKVHGSGTSVYPPSNISASVNSVHMGFYSTYVCEADAGYLLTYVT